MSSNLISFGAEPQLILARQHAAAGRFADLLDLCRHVSKSLPTDLNVQLDISTLLSAYGFLTDARDCCKRAQIIDPADQRATVNLANLARDAGNHGEARRLYADLLASLPNHPVIRRNALTSLEYDPDVTDIDRLTDARGWGVWAIAQAGGPRPRPTPRPLGDRPLRLGYVSADFCQHTVGLLLRDVIKAHDPKRVHVSAYSAGHVNDWVTDEISSYCRFRDVSALNDTQLAQQICEDRIDVLVDLSGHTAGSRLTVFALRPAAVQVSWLGYFATTGLSYIDAVLLDKWHAPPGTEDQFLEPIIRLSSRLCYTPVPWMPAISPTPPFAKGHVTFGSFNNTAKYNPQVFDLWAAILRRVPASRLILKWRTFNDDAFRRQVIDAFVQRGVQHERIELRLPSFHVDLLREYNDIDIALDPFPFTGGLTSCEALWMGVPVITWPQSRVVSRQTHAVLNLIGASELSVQSGAEYVSTACDLASGQAKLQDLAASLRHSMSSSYLFDTKAFCSELESELINLHLAAEQLKNNAGNESLTRRKAPHPANTHDCFSYGRDRKCGRDTLSGEAPSLSLSVQVTEAEITQLNHRIAIAQTARAAYLQRLTELLSGLEH